MTRIKAIIFDLDDTLYDCTGSLVESARRRAAAAMVKAGLPMSVEEAYRLQLDLLKRYGMRCNVFDRIAEQFGLGEDLVNAALAAYNSDEVGEIQPFPDVVPTLQRLRSQGYLLFLVTSGVHARQTKKIERLGLAPYFDEIIVQDKERGMAREDCFLDLMTRYNLRPEEIVSVGDRIHSEIRVSNYLRMTTVQMMHGQFQSLLPKSDLEEPDYRIHHISEILEILAQANKRRSREQLRIVAIGGGTGLPIVLRGLKKYTRNLTALVTVMDSGRSSGKLRRDLGVLPPGDARNCLIALSASERSEKRLYDLFQYRFEEGDLRGMSFGNLFLAALEKITGSFEEALREASNILAIEGRVLPSTLANVHVCARLADGSVVREEFNVRRPHKAPIAEIFLEPPDAPACEDAVSEIERADLVVFGPGSLFTSVLPNLLVRGITAALRRSRATMVYVCNIVTQPGQTDGMTARDHVAVLVKYLGDGMLDYIIVNSAAPPPDIMRRYEADGAALLQPADGLEEFGAKVVAADLLEDLSGGQRILWEKQDLLRHDPDKLAHILVDLR